jgi:hypothetical protein
MLVSCKKDKLEENYAILQGKWKWVGSTKYEKHYSYPTNTSWTTSDWISASGKTDDYFLEFERKGKVAIWKNEREIKFYRLETVNYEEDFQSTSLPNGVIIGMNLNFNADKPMSCNLNEDTMYVSCNFLRLPLEHYPIDNPQSIFYFSHKFVRIN